MKVPLMLDIRLNESKKIKEGQKNAKDVNGKKKNDKKKNSSVVQGEFALTFVNIKKADKKEGKIEVPLSKKNDVKVNNTNGKNKVRESLKDEKSKKEVSRGKEDFSVKSIVDEERMKKGKVWHEANDSENTKEMRSLNKKTVSIEESKDLQKEAKNIGRNVTGTRMNHGKKGVECEVNFGDAKKQTRVKSENNAKNMSSRDLLQPKKDEQNAQTHLVSRLDEHTKENKAVTNIHAISTARAVIDERNASQKGIKKVANARVKKFPTFTENFKNEFTNFPKNVAHLQTRTSVGKASIENAKVDRKLFQDVIVKISKEENAVHKTVMKVVTFHKNENITALKDYIVLPQNTRKEVTKFVKSMKIPNIRVHDVTKQILVAVSKALENQKPPLKIEIHLNPPELGKITMKIVEKAGKTIFLLNTQNAKAHEIMKMALPIMTMQLSQLSFNVVEVQLNGQQWAFSEDGQRRRESERHSKREEKERNFQEEFKRFGKEEV